MRLVSPLPLEYQPGTRWLYHTSADVLGVLVARAAGQPLGTVLQERIFEPLGMRDTGFAVPAADLARFGPCYWNDPASGSRAGLRPGRRRVEPRPGLPVRWRRARLDGDRLPGCSPSSCWGAGATGVGALLSRPRWRR